MAARCKMSSRLLLSATVHLAYNYPHMEEIFQLITVGVYTQSVHSKCTLVHHANNKIVWDNKIKHESFVSGRIYILDLRKQHQCVWQRPRLRTEHSQLLLLHFNLSHHNKASQVGDDDILSG